jgi:hypothetical protein
VDLIASDLRQITPSDGPTPSGGTNFPPVNFFAIDNNYYSFPALDYLPLEQSLPGSLLVRTNILNYFFVLGRENTKWIGIGYAVNPASSSPLYPLYRFYAETNLAVSPVVLFNNFQLAVDNAAWTNLSHVMNGVVHFVVRAYDANGFWMTNGYSSPTVPPRSTAFSAPIHGEVGFFFYSNAVPASVELSMGVLEDRPLARAESMPFQSVAQSNYLAQQAGKVHLFRQRVTVPNVDLSAYQ